MYNFDQTMLAIATNIPMLLKTGFVIQGHILQLDLDFRIRLG